jgi:hypothetical protein
MAFSERLGLSIGLLSVFCFFLCPLSAASADQYAYWTDGLKFGILDLNTGVASTCGPDANELFGLGMGPGGVLYGGDPSGNLYTVNPSNGVETLVGQTNVSIWNFGSTKATLYAADRSGYLYRINPTNAHAKLIGNMGFGPVSLSGMSTGSSSLYMASGTSTVSLYTVNVTTGRATLVGTEPDMFDALIAIGSKLFGQDASTFGYYSINKKTAKIKEIVPTTLTTALFGLVLVPVGGSTSCGT